MRKINILIIALSLLLTSCSENSTSEKRSYKKYSFKSAIIEYTISGNSTGTKTKYIKDYGYKQAETSEITTSIIGFKSTEKKDVIMVGSIINKIDHQTKSVIKINSPYAEKYAENIGEDYIKTGEEVLIALGFKKSGTETILEKKCTIWKGINTIWIWQGLVLKSETNIMGMKVFEIATSIKTNVNVPSSHFETPSNYTIHELQNQDVMSEFDNAKYGLLDEDKQLMKQVQNMSFEDFKKMIKNEESEISDQEIKNTYKMMKQFSKTSL